MDHDGRTPDFPAGHSMDTEWFAVDEEGHVGRFLSGEDGAVPDRAASGSGPVDPSMDWRLLTLVRLGALIDSDPSIVARDQDGGDLDEGADANIVLLVERTGAYRDPGAKTVFETSDEFDCVTLHTSPRVLCRSREPLPAERRRELARFPGVLWCTFEDGLEELAWRSEDGQDGMFNYAHDFGDDPGAYVRGAAPSEPLSVADLPERLRADVSRLTLPLSFAAQERVHLADHLTEGEVAIWGDVPLRYPPGSDQPPAPAPPVAPAAQKVDVSAALWAAVVFLLVLAAGLVLRRCL